MYTEPFWILNLNIFELVLMIFYAMLLFILIAIANFVGIN